MPLTTRQVIAMRNIAHALNEFYSDCEPAVTDFIPPWWVDVIRNRTALLCEQCHGEGQVGGLTPNGYDSDKCDACNGTGLNLEKH